MARSLRQTIKKLENAVRGDVEWFVLQDGSRYYYSPEAVGIELFLFAADSLRGGYFDGPPAEEPEILGAIRQAQNPTEVIYRFAGPNGFDQAFVNLPEMVFGSEAHEGDDLPDEVVDLSD